MNDYVNVIRNHYADFKGRARRREYWTFTLINTVVVLLLQIPVQGAILALAAQEDSGGAAPGFAGVTLVFALVLLIYSLAVLVPSVAVTVRRLHDTGRSGWWYLLNLVPLGSLVLLVFCVLDSEPGSNRWGRNPKGLDQASPVRANNW